MRASDNISDVRFRCLQVSMTSTGFGGQQFWELLRNSAMEREVRSYFTDAKSVLPKRGGAPLQVSKPGLWSALLRAVHSPDPLCRTQEAPT